MSIRQFLCGGALLITASIGYGADQPLADDPDLRRGVEAFKATDMMGAMPYLSRAADKGFPVAQRLLGYILVRGEENAAGVRWYLKAAEQGDAESQLALSEVIFQKKPGVDLSHEEGVAWLMKAVDQNYPEAVLRLASLKELGLEGIEVDFPRALELYHQAAELGHTNGMFRLVNIYGQGELGVEKNPEKSALWQQRLDQALAAQNKE